MNGEPMEIIEATAITKTIEASGLVPTSAKALTEAFEPIFEQARAMVAKSANINVTDATQVSEMKAARAARSELKTTRIACDKLRESLKKDSLNYGRAVQSAYNLIAAIIEPEEARLETCEKFAERAEAARQEGLRKSRTEALAPYGIDTSIYPLGIMKDDAFSQLLNGTRLAYEAKIAAAKKAEDDRIAKEKADAEERAQIKAENDRLRQEAEAERRQAAEVLRKNNEARLAAEAKVKAEADAKAKAEADAARAAKKAAAAPDAQKLRELARAVRAMTMPTVTSPEAKSLVEVVGVWFNKLADKIEEETAKLGGAA